MTTEHNTILLYLSVNCSTIFLTCAVSM